jgi:hypothetical protein
MKIYVDIETIPGPVPPTIEELMAEAPGNLKKAETIAKWAEDNREERYRKQALDPMQGRTLAIGWAVDDGPVDCLAWPMHCDDEFMEMELLQSFEATIAAACGKTDNVTWIAHNAHGFDMPWIKKKAIQYRRTHLARRIELDRYRGNVVCTSQLWNGGDPRAYTKLDKLAKFLGVGAKTEGMDGSKVYEAYLEGQLKEIAMYCADDVSLLREVYVAIQSGQGKPPAINMQPRSLQNVMRLSEAN